MKNPEATNDVHSPSFESKLDPHFTNTHKDGPSKTRKTGGIGGYKRRKTFFLQFAGNPRK